MSTVSIVNRAKLDAWASHFAEQKASGLTVADWCQRNGISRNSYFYWKRKLKDEAVSQALPEIVPLAVPPVLVSVSNSQVLTPFTVPDPNVLGMSPLARKCGGRSGFPVLIVRRSNIQNVILPPDWN